MLPDFTLRRRNAQAIFLITVISTSWKAQNSIRWKVEKLKSCHYAIQPATIASTIIAIANEFLKMLTPTVSFLFVYCLITF